MLIPSTAARWSSASDAVGVSIKFFQSTKETNLIMNDLVQHQQELEQAGVSKGIVHQEDSSPQHPPKFSVGDEVIWAYVEAHDYGVVVECMWTTQTVHRVTG
jgi:hypothetical protein